MIDVYAVFPADYKPEEAAIALFSNRTDAEFFISANETAERDFSAKLIIQHWEVSNDDFMRSI